RPERGHRAPRREQKLLGARPLRPGPRLPPPTQFHAATRNPMTSRLQFGIDRLIADPALRRPLAGRRIALLAHPASVTADLTHSLDALAVLPDIKLSAAFGPQHGLRGDKQDNMVESPDFLDP